jgi:hypothetical protein
MSEAIQKDLVLDGYLQAEIDTDQFLSIFDRRTRGD